MNNLKYIKIFFLVIILFFSNSTFSFAETTPAVDTNVNLNVDVYCNNNGRCEGPETILSCPLDCTPRGGSVPGIAFSNLSIIPSYTSVTIKWKSSMPSMINVKWGTSPDYKDGSLENINFLLDHEVVISNLKEGTFYYFKIQSQNFLGGTDILDSQTFQTLSSLDTTPPSNPSGVSAISNSSGITISWTNPSENDFDYIRVMKNTDRYYGSPFSGYLVYEGSGNYFTDSRVAQGTKYFYSLFARDKTGNYSSGSLIDLTYQPTSEINILAPEIPVKNIEPWKIKTPSEKYLVSQSSSVYDFYPGNIFNLSGDEPIIIKTDYSSVLQNDDTWIEIKNNLGGNSGKYLFSRAKGKDNFTSVTIPVFQSPGFYRFTIYRYVNGGAQIVNYGSFQISKTVGAETPLTPRYLALLNLVILIISFQIIMLLRRLLLK